MAIIKCKMCGGDLALSGGGSVCECEYCGTKQTIPTADSEKKTNLFNRANRLRMNAEFDKAAAVYSSITAEFPEESEAYWGLCLCKYGIEYVDDPLTGNKIPTCHRTLTTSIMDDSDFDQACENADPISKALYREEAKSIDRLQQSILRIVANEKPYDVFICYKETDDKGERTEDSVIAQDIYDTLTEKGLKVFFSRITLEDKLGQEYEPYIYAALHSAKVMLTVGTKYEYFDAVWVKNEWLRFLNMMQTDKSKTLIPCYKGIDAYDMPREFKNLQALNMEKLGWLQDLVRGVMKLIGNDGGGQSAQQTNSGQPQQTEANPTVSSLLQRTDIFLEDQDWINAALYANKALDIEPTQPRAYLALLLTELKIPRLELLPSLEEPFLDNPHCRRLLRYADKKLADTVKEKNQEILDRKEHQKQDTLQQAKKLEEQLILEERSRKEAEIKEINQLLNKLTSQKENIQQELSTLRGLFTAGKRKELETRLAAAKADIVTAKARLSRLGNQEIKIAVTEPDQMETEYKIANLYLSIQMYDDASLHFSRIIGYKDVNRIIRDNKHFAIDQMPAFRQVGNYVTFGFYPQTAEGADSTPIEWVVLDYDAANNRTLLISRYGLDAKLYNEIYGEITWEKCTLRSWLNRAFFSKAFSPAEKSAILTTDVNNSPSQGFWGNDGGNNTQDKLFLLSYAEAKKYFDVTSSGNNQASQAKPTEYAVMQRKNADSDSAEWWLRSPGTLATSASHIGNDGSLLSSRVNYARYFVRPVLWIDLKVPFFDRHRKKYPIRYVNCPCMIPLTAVLRCG